MFGANKDSWFGFILVGGTPKASGLLVHERNAGGTSITSPLVGSTIEAITRAQMQPRFQFDDMYYGNSMGGYRRLVSLDAIDTAGAYTVLASDTDTLFVADVIGSNAVFTLPDRVVVGARYAFYNAIGQTMQIASGGSQDNIITGDNVLPAVSSATAASDFITTDAIAGTFIEIIGYRRVGGNGTFDAWLSIVRPSAVAQNAGNTTSKMATLTNT
jgi:hypothetical protein